MSDAGPTEPARVDPALRPLEGGKLLSEITNRIVSLTREHYGRGPIKTKTYVLDNLIVCVLSDGFTAIERTMMDGGEAERVLEIRRDFQRMMKNRYSKMIEELTGRKVLAFLNQVHVEPRPHDRDVPHGRAASRLRRARTRRPRPRLTAPAAPPAPYAVVPFRAPRSAVRAANESLPRADAAQ
jgi:uncharacterized protein YbcI